MNGRAGRRLRLNLRQVVNRLALLHNVPQWQVDELQARLDELSRRQQLEVLEKLAERLVQSVAREGAARARAARAAAEQQSRRKSAST